MEGLKVSFQTWYIAMAFMGYSKKIISAAELQRQLNRRYFVSGVFDRLTLAITKSY
ncbi:MAG: hypothetical protein ACK4K0_01275 [Flavobacteriales bacterium]